MGLKSKVSDAYARGHELLNRYAKAVTQTDYVTWKYLDPNTNSWMMYSVLKNHELENAYKVSRPIYIIAL